MVIIDYASDEKPDVPSGTSRELAETLAAIREPTIRCRCRICTRRSRRAVSASAHPDPLGALPSYMVTTEIVFAAPGERLTIRHDPGLTADPYVARTLLAVRASPPGRPPAA